MKENPASSRAFRFTADNMPASATTIMSPTPCRLENASSTGMRVLVSALLPSNRWISRGKPAGSTSSPTWTWGVHAVLLAHPHPPQLVFLLSLASAAS
jgi:hypothetical protein